MTQPSVSSPISRRVHMDNVPEAGRVIEIIADEGERAALADAHDLLALDLFHADLTLRNWRRDGFRLTGTIRVEATQQCVVTLEPVPAKLEIPVDTLLVPEDSALASMRPSGQEELVIDVESEDPPETFDGGFADIGALCEELFALALDPYPRAPGAEFLDRVEDDSPPPSPFERLKELGRRR